ncbi:Uncharacterised protein [Salmonella enterica subsp. arizonae]|uniref:Uncharacterized protein n=1 Tax=Salmonella enterica subsp. arizonae TaxID=59203 RepID=A0A3S4G0U3_SALER|nr:Uncharacterised protein [Salmonella enterica subsp. arizonae]
MKKNLDSILFKIHGENGLFRKHLNKKWTTAPSLINNLTDFTNTVFC